MDAQVSAALIALAGVAVGYFVSPLVEILKSKLNSTGKRTETVATLRFVLGYLQASKKLLDDVFDGHRDRAPAAKMFAEFDLKPVWESIEHLSSFHSSDTLRSGATQYLTTLLVILLTRFSYLQKVISSPDVSEQTKREIRLGIDARVVDLRVFLSAVYARYLHIDPKSLTDLDGDIQNFHNDWMNRRFSYLVENQDGQNVFVERR